MLKTAAEIITNRQITAFVIIEASLKRKMSFTSVTVDAKVGESLLSLHFSWTDPVWQIISNKGNLKRMATPALVR